LLIKKVRHIRDRLDKRSKHEKIIIYVITILAILNLMACEQTSQPVTPTPPQTTTQTPSTDAPSPEPVEVLNPPTNLSILDDVLTWDASDEAEEYTIIIGFVITTKRKENSIDLKEFHDRLPTGVVTIQVLSQSGDRVSTSAEVIYNVPIKPPSNVTLSMDSNNTL
jgi:hypothetical protein